MKKRILMGCILVVLMMTMCFAFAACGTVTVTFMLDEDVYATADADEEGKIAMPEDPAKDGYRFDAWYSDEDFTTLFSGAELIENSTTVYAKMDFIVMYTITFDSDGGSAVSSVEVEEGLTATYSSPTKDGYLFAGWYTDKTYATQLTPSTAITSNMTVYANWVEISADAEPATTGLTYTLNSEGTGYLCSGIEGDDTGVSLVFDSYYEGLPVVGVGEYAFQNSLIEGVTFGENMTSIETYAFQNCDYLLGVIIPDSITSMGALAFQHSAAIETVVIGNGLTVVPDRAFATCTAISSLTLGSSVTTLEYRVFYRAYALTSVVIPASMTQMDGSALGDISNLTSITFEDTTGWYGTTSDAYTGGSAIDVTDDATNASNIASYYWYKA